MLPVLPLVLAILVLSPVVDPDDQLKFLKLKDSDYLKSPFADYRHLGDLLTYFAFAGVHCAACLAVIAAFLRMTLALPEQARQEALRQGLLVLLLVFAVMAALAIWANETVLVQLGYKAICMTLKSAPIDSQLTVTCFGDRDITPLTLLAWIPTSFGMLAVVSAAAFAHGNTEAMPSSDDPNWRTLAEQRTKALQKTAYALSVVLVTSTITISLFAHLPLGVLAKKGELADAVSHYASGLSTFWGALFSLTLLLTFAVPAWRLLRRALAVETATQEGAAIRTWLREHVFVSIRKQLLNAFSLLAPLMVGPLSSLISSFAGSG